MAKPGIVLRRPVGSDVTFREHADLPTAASLDAPARREARPAKPKPAEAQKVDERPTAAPLPRSRKSSGAAKDSGRRKKLRRRKARALRKAAMEKTEAELEVAVREHDKTMAAIEQDLAAVQRRADAEQKRWEKLTLKRICVTQAGDGPSGRQVYAVISLSFGSLPRFSLMRLRRCPAARASHSAPVVIFQINAVNVSEIAKTIGFVAGIAFAHAGAGAELRKAETAL